MIKKHDFIEVDFIGKLKENNKVFDLTKESDAKKYNLHKPNSKYGSLIVCIGERHLLKGIDDFLIGKKEGTYTIELKPEDAFGIKDPGMMKMIPLNIFQKQNIKPFPGLQVNMDGILGTVRAVSGGRVIMDFNHPLAGKEVIYEIEVKRIIKEDKEKIKGLLEIILHKADFEFKEGKLTIKADLPEQYQKVTEEKLKTLIPSIKEVHFKTSDKE